jgi:hypothetical protein
MDIFNVELTSADGAWTDSFGSEGALAIFMRGVEAGQALGGHMECWEIPYEPSGSAVVYSAANES